MPVVVDPKGCDYSRYRGATVITPNTREARLALGHGDDEIDLDWVGQELLQLVGGTPVLITRGEAGMTLYRAGLAPWSIPALTRAVFDVTGAGDTVVSTVAMALAAGADLESAADLANTAAGIAVGRPGAVVVTIADLRDALGQGRPRRGLAASGRPVVVRGPLAP
jgi:D-beta-D-heptose 7-phosphate kinase/D-beta-D-heptose 1-phosphate adenosyltransferase